MYSLIIIFLLKSKKNHVTSVLEEFNGPDGKIPSSFTIHGRATPSQTFITLAIDWLSVTL